MRRISSGIPARLFALASLFALALTMLFGGVASAATSQASPAVVSCLSASPASQIVIRRETAWVTVTDDCSPVTTATYLQVTWGDGTIEDYPLTSAALPIIVDTSHAYINTGAYHPLFCLEPSPITATPICTTVQILVAVSDPPVA
jgi:hypothetical protein